MILSSCNSKNCLQRLFIKSSWVVQFLNRSTRDFVHLVRYNVYIMVGIFENCVYIIYHVCIVVYVYVCMYVCIFNSERWKNLIWTGNFDLTSMWPFLVLPNKKRPWRDINVYNNIPGTRANKTCQRKIVDRVHSRRYKLARLLVRGTYRYIDWYLLHKDYILRWIYALKKQIWMKAFTIDYCMSIYW